MHDLWVSGAEAVKLATRVAEQAHEKRVRDWPGHFPQMCMLATSTRGVYTARMDPISLYLTPFLPISFLVAAIVAFVRELFTKTDPKTGERADRIDGKARVLPLVALVSFGVVVWLQYRANPGVLFNWIHIAGETAAVFFLAAGGTTFVQRIKDRLPYLPGEPLVETRGVDADEMARTMSKVLENISKPPKTVVEVIRPEPSNVAPAGSVVVGAPDDKASSTPDEITPP